MSVHSRSKGSMSDRTGRRFQRESKRRTSLRRREGRRREEVKNRESRESQRRSSQIPRALDRGSGRSGLNEMTTAVRDALSKSTSAQLEENTLIPDTKCISTVRRIKRKRRYKAKIRLDISESLPSPSNLLSL